MFTIKKFTSVQALFLFGLLMGVFIIYPNIAQIPWDIFRGLYRVPGQMGQRCRFS